MGVFGPFPQMIVVGISVETASVDVLYGANNPSSFLKVEKTAPKDSLFFLQTADLNPQSSISTTTLFGESSILPLSPCR